MDCKEVEQYLQFFIDGELDDDDRRMLEEHLAVCPPCRATADYERRFVSAIRSRIPKVQVPADLRDRVQKIIINREQKGRPFVLKLAFGSVPAVAVLALVITFTWTVTSAFSGVVDEAVEQHSTLPPVEVNSADSSEVEGWFKEKVNFNVALPRFDPQGMHLVGGRLSNLIKQKAALVRYRQAGHDFSLFVFSDPGGSLEGKTCHRIKTREICLTELRGYTVVLWRSRGLAYSLVGDSEPQEMVRFLTSANSF